MKKLKLLGMLMLSFFLSLTIVKADEKLTEGIFDEMPKLEDIAEGYSAFYIVTNHDNSNAGKWIIMKNSDIEFDIYIDDEYSFQFGDDSYDESIEFLEDDYNETQEDYKTSLEKYEDGSKCYNGIADSIKILENVKMELDKKVLVSGPISVVARGVTPVYDEFFIPLFLIDRFPIKYTFTYKTPENLPEVEDGLTRKYYAVMYDANGLDLSSECRTNIGLLNNYVVEEIDDSDNDGEFEISYDGRDVNLLILYEDVDPSKEKPVEETPIEDVTETSTKEEIKPANTFDGITNYAGITVVSLVLVLGTVLYFKKKYN